LGAGFGFGEISGMGMESTAASGTGFSDREPNSA
jgi:hypothetical protein